MTPQKIINGWLLVSKNKKEEYEDSSFL